MRGLFASVEDALRRADESVTEDLTLIARKYAQESGWPSSAWGDLRVDIVNQGGSRRYRIGVWRQDGDLSDIRALEYGVGQEPNPAMHRMANRIPATARKIAQSKIGVRL